VEEVLQESSEAEKVQSFWKEAQGKDNSGHLAQIQTCNSKKANQEIQIMKNWFGKKKKKYTEAEKRYIKNMTMGGLLMFGPVGALAGRMMGKMQIKTKRRMRKRKRR